MSGLLLACGRRSADYDPGSIDRAFALLARRGSGGASAFDSPTGSIRLAELPVARAASGGTGLATDPERRIALALDGRIDRWGPPEAAPPPQGESDAERLLRRYLSLGEAFLDDVRGSYVVALLDARAHLALAARDGLGNRYAAYTLDSQRFALASDDAALLALPGVSAELDPLRLAEFYGSAELAGDETFFRGVRALLPGEMLLVERDAVRRRVFDRPDLAARVAASSWEEYVEVFAERLREAVARRLRGVARAAVWLSGGLDSGPVAALAAARLGATAGAASLMGLCWEVGHAAGDELAWARAVGAHAGFPVESVPCADADPFRPLARWPVRASTPEQTAYRWYHERSYERASALGAEVVLWGFGGDMLYAAPRRWLWDLARAEGVGRAIDRLREAAAERGWRRVLRSELLGPVLRPRRRLTRTPASWLTPRSRALLSDRAPWPPGRDAARRPRQAERLLALLDAFGIAVEAADAARHGLALATPLRDRDLVELALAVPDHLLLQGAETRPVLRAAVRGLVPEEIRLRRGKGSFQVAVERALRPENRPWARTLLEHPDALWRGHVEPAAIARWLGRCPAGDDDDLGFTLAIHGELWRRKRAGEELGALEQLAL